MSPNGWIGWLLILASLGFFIAISKLCARFLAIPSGVSRCGEFRVFRWRNLVVSFIHASITGCWSVTCVILYGKEMLPDLVLYVNWPVYAMCAFAMGYFLYDTLDILIAKRAKEKWEVLLHHVAVLIISGYVITFTHCVGYQAFGMLIEVNTIFLHRRQLFKLAAKNDHDEDDDRSLVVRANIYANLFTFLSFRLFPLAYLTYGVFYDGHRLPGWFRRFYTVCILLIDVINVVLLYRLIRADIWPPVGGGGDKEEESKLSCPLVDKNSNNCCWADDEIRPIEEDADNIDLRRVNGLRLRNNVDRIMKHVVERNVHS